MTLSVKPNLTFYVRRHLYDFRLRLACGSIRTLSATQWDLSASSSDVRWRWSSCSAVWSPPPVSVCTDGECPGGKNRNMRGFNEVMSRDIFFFKVRLVVWQTENIVFRYNCESFDVYWVLSVSLSTYQCAALFPVYTTCWSAPSSVSDNLNTKIRSC